MDSPASPPLSLTISELSANAFDPTALLPTLSKISDKVESLTLVIVDSYGLPESLLSYLSKPYQTATGELGWRFPNLRGISVVKSGYPPPIGQLPRLVLGRLATDGVEGPPRLRKLNLSAGWRYNSPDEVQELQRLLGASPGYSSDWGGEVLQAKGMV